MSRQLCDLTAEQIRSTSRKLPSEHKAQLCLKLAMQRRLCVSARNLTEIRAGNRQCRGSRFGMVEHVRRVHPELERLAFTDGEGLHQVCVKAPLPGTFHHSLSQRSTRTRLGMLEQNLSCCGIGDRIDGALPSQVLQRGDLSALRIVNGNIGVLGKVVTCVPNEIHFPLSCREWPHNVGSAKGIKHVLCGDARGLSAVEVDDPTHLPPFDDLCQRT